MTTAEMIRCKKCSNLVIDKNRNWICECNNEEISTLTDDECELNTEW